MILHTLTHQLNLYKFEVIIIIIQKTKMGRSISRMQVCSDNYEFEQDQEQEQEKETPIDHSFKNILNLRDYLRGPELNLEVNEILKATENIKPSANYSNSYKMFDKFDKPINDAHQIKKDTLIDDSFKNLLNLRDYLKGDELKSKINKLFETKKKEKESITSCKSYELIFQSLISTKSEQSTKEFSI